MSGLRIAFIAVIAALTLTGCPKSAQERVDDGTVTIIYIRDDRPKMPKCFAMHTSNGSSRTNAMAGPIDCDDVNHLVTAVFK